VPGWLAAHWYPAQIVVRVLRSGLWLVAAYVLSGAGSAAAFARSLGLNQRPDLRGWVGACAAIAISLADRYGGARGWTSPNPVGRGFYAEGGEALLFYVLYVISAGPFAEEAVLRGFAFRGFRGGYGRVCSIIIIVGAGAYIHWRAMTQSIWTPVCLISLWTLLCLIMEWTVNPWNCVLCHAAYNAVQVFKWPIYPLGMLIILPLCMRRRRLRETGSNGVETSKRVGS